jgi:hypothetical protein
MLLPHRFLFMSHLLNIFFRKGKGCVGSSEVKYKQERKELVQHKEQGHETTQSVCKRDTTLVSTD